VKTARMTSQYSACECLKTGAGPIVLLAIIMGSVACNRPTRKSPVIEKFRTARCIAPNGHPNFPSSSRAWNQQLKIRTGEVLTIIGFQGPGSRVFISRENGREFEVANPGDYIYADDVRYDDSTEILYVRAQGLAGGISKETWLFTFDINRAQQTARLKVDPDVLPPVCSPLPK
jgi:hypothetical protein